MSRSEIIIGVDEVGRGALYGPLVLCAAARFNDWHSDEVKDSKDVKSEKRRQKIAFEIRKNLAWVVTHCPAAVINRHGMTRPLQLAGLKAANALLLRVRTQFPDVPVKIVFDGTDHQASKVDELTSIVSIEKADRDIFECSAASLVAKVWRDNWVNDQVAADASLAEYGFLTNKGYGTAQHHKALQTRGLTPHHRTKFCKTFLTPKDTNAGSAPEPQASLFA